MSIWESVVFGLAVFLFFEELHRMRKRDEERADRLADNLNAAWKMIRELDAKIAVLEYRDEKQRRATL
jgi:hypothetical protein